MITPTGSAARVRARAAMQRRARIATVRVSLARTRHEVSIAGAELDEHLTELARLEAIAGERPAYPTTFTGKGAARA